MIDGVAGDIAAHRAEALGERALDHMDARHHAFAFADAAAARAIHADRMHLVDIGHRAIALGERDDVGDRRDIAVHRIEAFEDDQLGPIARFDQQLFEMRKIVMAKDLLLGARALHAFDHRIMVRGVGQNDAVGQQVGDRRDRREIGNPAGGEDERGFLAVQIGEFALKLDNGVAGAGNVAGAAGAGADPASRVDHRGDHVGVLTHAEIVVGAPYGHGLDRAVVAMPIGEGKSFDVALQMRKDAVAALVL